MSVVVQKHSRMPRKRNPARAALADPLPKSIAHMGRLEDASPQQILAKYLTDESTQTIAESYGVTRQALAHFLIKHAEEDWKDAQMARALARKEKAEEAMEKADDPLNLARAREMLKSAQWDLERVCKRIYGIDRDFNVNLNFGDLGDRLRRARERSESVVGGVEGVSENTWTEGVVDNNKDRAEPVCLARTRANETQLENQPGIVQPPHYDNEAVQQQQITAATPVDRS